MVQEVRTYVREQKANTKSGKEWEKDTHTHTLVRIYTRMFQFFINFRRNINFICHFIHGSEQKIFIYVRTY